MNFKSDSPLVSRVVPARYFGRLPDRRVLWVVLHTVECGEALTADDATAAMFKRGDRKVSAHYVVGDEILQCVPEADCAWAAGHTANLYGIHIEIVGRASQKIVDWHDAYSTVALGLVAKLLADICTRHDLPIEQNDVDGARALRPGVLDHRTCSDAFHESNHVDVGDAFPWTEVIAAARAIQLDGPPVGVRA